MLYFIKNINTLQKQPVVSLKTHYLSFSIFVSYFLFLNKMFLIFQKGIKVSSKKNAVLLFENKSSVRHEILSALLVSDFCFYLKAMANSGLQMVTAAFQHVPGQFL